MPVYEEPAYESRTVVRGGSSMNMLGVFLISLLIIGVVVAIVLHAIHVF